VGRPDWDFKCIKTKSLYLTLLKQHRYTPFVCDLITHTCYEWPLFTADVSETLCDSLSFASPESTRHIFTVMDSFLAIQVCSRCSKRTGVANKCDCIHRTLCRKSELIDCSIGRVCHLCDRTRACPLPKRSAKYWNCCTVCRTQTRASYVCVCAAYVLSQSSLRLCAKHCAATLLLLLSETLPSRSGLLGHSGSPSDSRRGACRRLANMSALLGLRPHYAWLASVCNSISCILRCGHG
jgi:hypothetical protein